MPRDLTKGLRPTSKSIIDLAEDIEAELDQHPELKAKWEAMLQRHGNQKVLSGQFETDTNPGVIHDGRSGDKED